MEFFIPIEKKREEKKHLNSRKRDYYTTRKEEFCKYKITFSWYMERINSDSVEKDNFGMMQKYLGVMDWYRNLLKLNLQLYQRTLMDGCIITMDNSLGGEHFKN